MKSAFFLYPRGEDLRKRSTCETLAYARKHLYVQLFDIEWNAGSQYPDIEKTPHTCRAFSKIIGDRMMLYVN